MDLRDRLRGCLLAGGVGDALGAPLEFLSTAEIRTRWGPLGPESYPEGPYPAGQVTDDTQMTLFTAEGIIRAVVRGRERGLCVPTSVVHHAYLRWLLTQGERVSGVLGVDGKSDGWLVKEERLHQVRVPGNTCLSALRSGRAGSPEAPLNDSKGCGTVMRIAPAAIWAFAPYGFDPFDEGVAYGALTHGHPSGYLAGGAQALILSVLLAGRPLEDAIAQALERLKRHNRHEETTRAIEAATDAAAAGPPRPETVETLGEGWVAEEALAIGLYSALAAPDLHTGLRLAVAHGGDSDSTGAVAGNLLGAIHGPDAIPDHLLEPLEVRDLLELVADDLITYVVEEGRELTREDWERYPGW